MNPKVPLLSLCALLLAACGSPAASSTTGPDTGGVTASSPAPADVAAANEPADDSAAGEQGAFDPAGCPVDEGYEAALGCYLDLAVGSLDLTWGDALPIDDVPYESPDLQVFDAKVNTACGKATADDGPFYCPDDATIYLQRDFMVSVGEQAGAQGPYSGVIVLAHEWGHHVQSLLGIDDVFLADQAQVFGSDNAASVRNELMADCFAGWWSAQAFISEQFPIEESDVEDALLTLAEVGDDFDAQMEGSAVDPDTFDHGTVDQRTSWLAAGFDAGTVGDDPLLACDTFTITAP
ncbi:MAG: neutral zinc metallopeptidase [Candidatus Nanopelagicales bacterium]